MPRYELLRDMVSHRVRLDYDTGLTLTGYVIGCRPEDGSVHLFDMGNVEICDATGNCIEHCKTLLVPVNGMMGVRLAEGPSGRDG